MDSKVEENIWKKWGEEWDKKNPSKFAQQCNLSRELRECEAARIKRTNPKVEIKVQNSR
jgi:hypothetical protein